MLAVLQNLNFKFQSILIPADAASAKEAAAAAQDTEKKVPPSPGRISISRSCKAKTSAAAASKTSSDAVDPSSRPSAMSAANGTEGDASVLRSLGLPPGLSSARKVHTATAGPEDKEEAKKRITARQQAAADIDASGDVSRSESGEDTNDEDNNDDAEDGAEGAEEGSNYSRSNSSLDGDGSKSGNSSSAGDSDNDGGSNDDTNPETNTNPEKAEATARSPPMETKLRSSTDKADATTAALNPDPDADNDKGKAPARSPSRSPPDPTKDASQLSPETKDRDPKDTAKVTARSLSSPRATFCNPIATCFHAHVQFLIFACADPTLARRPVRGGDEIPEG
mgnify:FL=1|jgi:hypothetical protein